jgi:hypothetical protein
MTTQTVGTRRSASLPGGVTGYAGQPVTWSSSRTSMTRRSQQDGESLRVPVGPVRSIPSLEMEGASGSCPRNAGGGALVS